MLLEDSSLANRSWSVSELTAYIREIFDIDFRLQDVFVAGELSNFTRARSGHLYFTLKDERAQLKCVMWRNMADQLRFYPEDGDAIVAQGRVSVYEAGGSYQLYVESIEPVGRGDLAKAFEQLKEDLAVQGLFDAIHKRPIPEYPNKIGIVTSADAAALQDILNVLRRRWPQVSVLIAPTLVQGLEAPAKIIQALQWLDGRNDIDTIIIARGGGSMEDLWAFNDESLARAIFAAEHPIVTGIGHEIDFTIADFVADLRAPTPSAAAELTVPEQAEALTYIAGLEVTLTKLTESILRERRSELNSLRRTLRHLSPRTALDNSRQQLDWLLNRADQAMGGLLDAHLGRLSVAWARLEAVSPKATLARGYAIVRKKEGRIVRSIDDVSVGDILNVQVADGKFDAKVE
jgi:exodeoxyribonuclease VII large subunit